MTDRVFEAMDHRQVALLCMLDLSKCFDVIPHDRLLTKLQQYGVDTRWFSSYLSDHFQQTMIHSIGVGTVGACSCTPNIQLVGAGNVLCTPKIRQQQPFHFLCINTYVCSLT